MQIETDVCIVGGGVMGAATAHAISRMSENRILLLDRYGVGNEYCSSNDVNRVFRFAYGGDQFYTEMAIESLRLWKELEKETSHELLIPTGLLMLEGDDEHANRFNESSFRILTKLDVGAHVYDGTELRKRFPQFQAGSAFFDPHGGVLLASESLETFTSEAGSHGVKILEKRVTRFRDKSGLEIETAEGQTIRAKKLVVTAGPWTNSLLKDGLTGITPTRQQLIYLKPSRDLEKFRPSSCPVFFTDHHYGLPAAGIDGVKISNKELIDPVDPETARRSVDQEQIEQCREACRKFVPDLAEGDVVQTKVCLYDMTENSDFVIDRDPYHRDIVYGYGFSGHGFKFAPLIGKLLAQLVLDREPSFDLSRFSAQKSQRKPQLTSAQLGKGE
ncbi:N-methyl-L-tryptophan oxidase [Candidatus Bathyarchaeota archaeon]|nr:MAG: N-methyl-L-tryptophan oxidase [Candidatus Bathyarchaeota archaeon]